MSKRQRDFRAEILAFVASYFDANGYPPTYQEIGERIGLSGRSHVDYYLEALEKAGFVKRTPRRPRGLRLVGRTPGAFEVRTEGTIAAARAKN